MRANIAIVGSTGNAGRKTIEVLERRKFPVNILYLLASKKSVGKFIKFRNKNIEVRSLEDFDFRKADITFFCAGSKLAKTCNGPKQQGPMGDRFIPRYSNGSPKTAATGKGQGIGVGGGVSQRGMAWMNARSYGAPLWAAPEHPPPGP
jgi:hypothetical protein